MDHGFGLPRVRRGDMKFLLLDILKEGPRHGYEIINGLEGLFRGYRPSPGSVYPALQMLEEGGYLTSEKVDGRKVYTITLMGINLLAARGKTTYEETPRMKQTYEIRQSIRKLAAAVIDGSRESDEETMKLLSEILNKARKEVYALLAEL